MLQLNKTCDSCKPHEFLVIFFYVERLKSEDSEKWEPATLLLRRSGFQVEVGKNTIISESYTKDLLVSI